MTPGSTPTAGRGDMTSANDLDLFAFLCLLWCGRVTILSCALLCALTYAVLMRQERIATAITKQPTINLLGANFAQQTFLRNLDVINRIFYTSEISSMADEAYQVFFHQLTSYDTRRNFWLARSYYSAHKKWDTRANAVLLDQLINAIQFQPPEDMKKLPDTIKLVTETASDANQFLRCYIDYANKLVVQNLNQELMAIWGALALSLKAQIKRQEAVTNVLYNCESNHLNQALKLAQQHGIARRCIDISPKKLRQSELFLLGHILLEARVKSLQAAGPDYDTHHERNRAILSTLKVGPFLKDF